MQTQIPAILAEPNCNPNGFWSTQDCKDAWSQYKISVYNHNQAEIEYQRQQDQTDAQKTAAQSAEQYRQQQQQTQQEYKQQQEKIIQSYKEQIQANEKQYQLQIADATTKAKKEGEQIGALLSSSSLILLLVAFVGLKKIRSYSRLKIQQAIDEAVARKSASAS